MVDVMRKFAITVRLPNDVTIFSAELYTIVHALSVIFIGKRPNVSLLCQPPSPESFIVFIVELGHVQKIKTS